MNFPLWGESFGVCFFGCILFGVFDNFCGSSIFFLYIFVRGYVVQIFFYLIYFGVYFGVLIFILCASVGDGAGGGLSGVFIESGGMNFRDLASWSGACYSVYQTKFPALLLSRSMEVNTSTDERCSRVEDGRIAFDIF